MARSRKTPPLFEVMRETDRRVEISREAGGAGGGMGGGVLPRPAPPGEENGSGLRLSERDHETSSAARMVKGVPLPIVLSAAGILIGVVAVIAILAFNAGAKRERNQLLPSDTPPPVTSGDAGGSITDPMNGRQTPQPEKPRTETSKAPSKGGGAGVTPAAVFGDDPREDGKNYLIVERLLFDDAMAAAQFLTENGVPSVVVAPEGIQSEELSKQPRALWLVIAREGFTRDEFRAGSRANTIKEAVIHLGRRWKQDRKGTSDFASCLWDKYGK